MKILLIIYACIAIIWFIAQVYCSYIVKYKFEQLERRIRFDITQRKFTIYWQKIIFGAVFWPIDILVSLIKAIAMKNSW